MAGSHATLSSQLATLNDSSLTTAGSLYLL